MLCPSCGVENREGRKFCAECGRSLGAICPACWRRIIGLYGGTVEKAVSQG
jgi:predicted amidophosphoribosyltransferase